MDITLWTSTTETAQWLVKNTILKDHVCKLKQFIESDANNSGNFHRIPEAIKRILYLDAVDVIIEINKKPIFALEISQEAGSGHNVFQRFARIVAAAENNVPVAYIYPEAKLIYRESADRYSWDRLNPNIFTALEKVMRIHNSPALFYYYPSEFHGDLHEIPESPKGLIHDDTFLNSPNSSDSEMKQFFQFVDTVVKKSIDNNDDLLLINDEIIEERRNWMQEQFNLRNARINHGSPYSATIEVPTSSLLKFIKEYAGEDYEIGGLLPSREKTIIYTINNPTRIRSDPYTGVLATLDYLITRRGKNIEDRNKNLVLAWFKAQYDQDDDEIVVSDSNVSVNDFMIAVNRVRAPNRCLFAYDNFDDLSLRDNIARYYMQLNHSCRFTKRKDFRIYSVFADAILFKDGCFWKDG